MIELKGKYTMAKIFATTIEDGVYAQVYDIINNPAFKGQMVVCMPDVHVGAAGPCGLVATIGNYVCPEHIGVDIGCSVSMMVLDKKVQPCNYAELEHSIKTRIPFGMNINSEPVIDQSDFSVSCLTASLNTSSTGRKPFPHCLRKQRSNGSPHASEGQAWTKLRSTTH